MFLAKFWRHMISVHKHLWMNMNSKCIKHANRKVQGVPQSEAATNPRHQEEEKKDKN